MSFLRSLSFSIATSLLIFVSSCSGESQTQESVTTASETTTADASSHHDMNHGKPININTAILSELDKLEAKLGVPALSHKIQASRPYGSTQELVSKNVISQEQYDQVKNMVTIEEIELTGEAKDIDYMIKMGLMKGHLIVAKELIDQGLLAQAESHTGHPVEEIYIDIEEQLEERKVPAFKEPLMTLQELVKSNAEKAKIEEQFNQAMQAVDTAIQALPETQRNSPDFVRQVIDGLLEAAASEYQAAIANNKISEAIEYQDSRGFVLYSESLHAQVSEPMAKENKEAHQTIEQSFKELKTAWPSAVPPETPVKTPEQVADIIKQIEKAAQTAS
jgi:hypothetical protein